MKYLFPVIISLTPVAGLTAEEGEWIYVGESLTNGVHYVRTEDVMNGKSTQTAAKAWMKVDHSREANKIFRESKMLLEIDCPAQTFRHLAIVSSRPDGTVRSETTTNAPKKYVVPDSIVENVVKKVCNGYGG